MDSIRRTAIPVLRMVALVGVLAALFPTSSVAAQSNDVVAAETALTQASQHREGAETSLDELLARRVDIQTRFDAVSADTQDLTAQVAIARSQMLDSAVAAYVSGGHQEELSAILMSTDIHDAADRVNFLASQTTRLGDAVAEYDALRRTTEPEILALANELESVERAIVEAQDALAAARSHEADAERFLTEAENAAAAAAAATRVTVAPTSAPAAANNASTGSTSSSTTSSSAPAPTTEAPPVLVTKPAPAPQLPPSGGPTPEQWAALRQCESGGNYQIVSRSGRYRGAYQFDQRTWESVGGVGDPAAAPPAEQDLRAQLLYAQRGNSAWPHCGRYLR